jgi:tetratricopeptide (TPR) repeat protein
LLADEATFGAEVVERLVAEGYCRLGDDARRVMEALAVFDRPVDETAIAYLLHPWWPGLEVRASLRRLVSGYFVSASRVTGEYNLHPLDREYAYHRIPDNEESDAYNRHNLELRAAEFYAGLRKPKSEWKTIDDLAPQLAEFEHRVRAGDYDGACRVLNPIDHDYLLLWGHYARLVELLEKLLGRLTAPGLQATNLNSLGLAYGRLGQIERAMKFYEQALAIAGEIGDREREGHVLGNLGCVYYALGQVERAIKLLEEARAIAHEIGDRRAEVVWLSSLGDAYRDLGQVERAISLYEQSLTIARKLNDLRWGSDTLGSLGRAYRGLGQSERAIRFHEEALLIAREIGDHWQASIQLGSLGDTYRDLGQVERAIKLYEEALSIARETGDRWGESYQLLGLGQALLATGELSEARQRCVEARDLEVPETSYQAALALGTVLLHQREPAAGETFADAAARCRAMLDKTAGLYEPRYALAAAVVASAVCDPHWAEENERARLLAPALEEYRRALKICAAPGVVRDALRDLEMIRAAAVEGLEPAFELLKSARP